MAGAGVDFEGCNAEIAEIAEALADGREWALAEHPSPQDQRARFLALFERECQHRPVLHAWFG